MFFIALVLVASIFLFFILLGCKICGYPVRWRTVFLYPFIMFSASLATIFAIIILVGLFAATFIGALSYIAI